jgi:hypothetical protein
MSWAITAAVVGGAVIGGVASNKAADTAAEGMEAGADAQAYMFDRSAELNEPFRQGGMAAQNRLLELLGISSPGLDNMMSDEMNGPLVENRGGVPYVNAQRYATDPVYKQAWDQTLAKHKSRFGIGYDDHSSFQALEYDLQAAMDTMDPTGEKRGRSSGGTGPGGRSADFGKYAKDFSMSDFQADPGYAFRLSEGLKSLDRQAAARGGLISGGALKAAQRYGQDAASQEYTNAFNRYQVNRSNQMQPLQSLMGSGQTAATQIGNQAVSTGQGMASSYAGAADARASGYVGVGNAINSGIGNYLNYQQDQAMVNALSNRQRTGAPVTATVDAYGSRSNAR